MKIDSIEKLVALSKENIDAVVKSGTAASKGLEEVIKASQGIVTTSAEKVDSAFKSLTACKSPAEFLDLQGKLVRESVEGAIADSRKFAELTQSVVSATLEPINARVSALQSLAKAI